MALAKTTLAPGWSIGLIETDSLSSLLSRIEAGLRASAEQHLRTRLALPLEDMARLLGTSARTLGRRQAEGRLTAEESDRLYRYARLFERAVDVLGGEDRARQWMKKEQWALGECVPLACGALRAARERGGRPARAHRARHSGVTLHVNEGYRTATCEQTAE